MGNKSSSETNLIHENINILIDIGLKMEDKKYKVDKDYVISLYKTFYYPRHSLTILDEMYSNYPHLQNKLKNHIKLFNKYNLTNISEDDYVKTTLKSLKKTLCVIGLYDINDV
jgi:hypothetical protein